MGNNSSGFQNENNLMSAINDKRFCELNPNLQGFISNMYPCITSSDIIKCKKIAGQNKCDLQVESNGKTYRLSIKKGTGNSVHQEPVEPFIDYLKEEFNLSASLADDIRFFIWGDGTHDGTGQNENRLGANDFKKEFPKIIEELKKFFEKHKEALVRRFLLTGVCGDEIDFIYYGNENEGLWANRTEFLKVALDSSSNKRSIIPVGKLGFQAWNRALKKESKSEKKRGQIQLKWNSLEKDLQYISNNRR